MKLIGYYSATAARLFPNNVTVHTTPSGERVECTDVTPEGESSVSAWPDLVSVGEVVDCVKTRQPPSGVWRTGDEEEG